MTKVFHIRNSFQKRRTLYFEENVSSIYEKIVYWKNNTFHIPTSKGGRYFIDEAARLINAWVRGSPLKNIALKAVMIMPSLLIQKPSNDSKSKDHTKALERRLQLWTDGHSAELLKEGERNYKKSSEASQCT